MRSSLIYTPDFDGHRQVHVFVYAYILKELGFKVFVAGNLKQEFNDRTYVDKLKEDKNITLIDTSVYPENGVKISNTQFRELQERCEADLTIFSEADHHIELLNSQIRNKKRLRGRTIGLFLRPFYFYRKRSFLDKLRYIKHLPSIWKSDQSLFHEYLLKRFRLLDTAFYLDENFVSRHAHTFLLPDVFQQYAEMLIKDEIRNEKIEERVWIDRLEHFRDQNKGRFIFFYFGTAGNRKGYDVLLKMAIQYDACVVHCGLTHPTEKYSELKKVLQERGRLFETDQYISDPVCIEYFFKTTDHLLLPYVDFPGSSGVMLQSLSYGIPVLVPSNGIMGYLVKKYNLGLVYQNTEASLMEQFKIFKDIPAEAFRSSISEYMKTQSCQLLREELINAFTGANQSNVFPGIHSQPAVLSI